MTTDPIFVPNTLTGSQQPKKKSTHPCPACGCPILKNDHPLCRRCYHRLPPILKRALLQNFAGFQRALSHLTRP